MRIMVDKLPTNKDGKIDCVFSIHNKFCRLKINVYESGRVDCGRCTCEDVGCEELCCEKKRRGK